MPSRKPLDGLPLSEVGGSTTTTKEKALTEVVGKRTYVEVLERLEQSPVILTACKGCADISDWWIRGRLGWC
jgi:hypothetical protein